MTWYIYAHEAGNKAAADNAIPLQASTSERLGRAMRQAAAVKREYANVDIFVAQSLDPKHERHYLPAPRTLEQDQTANRAQLDPRVGHRKRRVEVQR